jgi:hypothetical protein
VSVDQLQQLMHAIAPNTPWAGLIAAGLIYLGRVLRSELSQNRQQRAASSTLGSRTGDVETALLDLRAGLGSLGHSLAAQGLYVPGLTTTTAAPAQAAAPEPGRHHDEDLADDDDLADWPPRPDDYARTEQHRTPVPPLPPLARR